MKSILSSLYHGKSDVQDIFFHDEVFWKMREAFSKQQEAFYGVLTHEQSEQLAKLLEDHADLLLYEVETNFQTGFCLGLLLMLEVFQIMDSRFSRDE